MSGYNYEFDFAKSEIYEIGAALVLAIAFPPDKNNTEKKLNDLHLCLCQDALRASYEADPESEWASSPQMIKPCYAFYPASSVQRKMNSINTKMTERLQAAKIAIAFMRESFEGHVPKELQLSLNKIKDDKTYNIGKKTSAVNKLTINTMLEVMYDIENMDPDNFEARILRPSFPVLHLAAALALNIDNSEKSGHPKTSLGDIIFDKEMIVSIIKTAEDLEGLLIKSKLWKNNSAEDLVRVRLASQPNILQYPDNTQSIC